MENEVQNQKKSYCHPSLQKVEDERSEFLKSYKKNNSIKVIIVAVCFILIIVACIVLPNVIDNTKLTGGLTLGLMVVALLITFIFSSFSKKIMNEKMKVYFENYYKNTNDFVFDDEKFENVKLSNPGKINLDQFNDNRLYKDVFEVGSRGLTEFEYNKIPMAVVDCAGNVKKEKRVGPVFVGKYLFGASTYLDDDIIVIYLKGNEKALPPTNLEGIEKVFGDEVYEIYTNSKKWEKVLTKKVIDTILELKTNFLLIDVAISIYGGRSFVLMGYDDPMMVLPLQHEYDSKPVEQYKKEIAVACKIVEALNK